MELIHRFPSGAFSRLFSIVFLSVHTLSYSSFNSSKIRLLSFFLLLLLFALRRLISPHHSDTTHSHFCLHQHLSHAIAFWFSLLHQQPSHALPSGSHYYISNPHMALSSDSHYYISNPHMTLSSGFRYYPKVSSTIAKIFGVFRYYTYSPYLIATFLALFFAIIMTQDI